LPPPVDAKPDPLGIANDGQKVWTVEDFIAELAEEMEMKIVHIVHGCSDVVGAMKCANARA
jgi:translation initiation factor 6 (eIF-6)